MRPILSGTPLERPPPLSEEEARAWRARSRARESREIRRYFLVAAGLVIAWVPCDFLLEPSSAPLFLLLRSVAVVASLGAVLYLRGRRSLLVVEVTGGLAVVVLGASLAVMLPIVRTHYWPYLIGFSLVFWGASVSFSWRPRALGLSLGAVLVVAGAALALAPDRRGYGQLVGSGFFLTSIAVIALVQSAFRRGADRATFLSSLRLSRAQREVLEGEIAKRDFFANASHDLRTPLTLIVGPAEQLAESPDLAPEDREILELIQRNARVLARRVDDLLAAARLDAGAMKASPRRADLAAIVRAGAGAFSAAAREHEIRLVVEAPKRLEVVVDEDHMQRVMLNLLTNALRHTPVGGEIRASLIDEGEDAARIEVADSGPGVPEVDRAVIFERFGQSQNAAAGGAGLGLAIVRELIALQGGHIDVDEAEEGGALFVMRIPKKPTARPDLDEEAALDDAERAPAGRGRARAPQALRPATGPSSA